MCKSQILLSHNTWHLFLSCCSSSSRLPFSLSFSIILFVLFYKMEEQLSHFCCDVKSVSLLLKPFSSLHSLSLHLSSTLPAVFYPLSALLPLPLRLSLSPSALYPHVPLKDFIFSFCYTDINQQCSYPFFLPLITIFSIISPLSFHFLPPPQSLFCFPSSQKPQSRPVPTRNTLTGSTEIHTDTHTHAAHKKKQ